MLYSYISGSPRRSIAPLTQGLKGRKIVVGTGFPCSHLASQVSPHPLHKGPAWATIDSFPTHLLATVLAARNVRIK